MNEFSSNVDQFAPVSVTALTDSSVVSESATDGESLVANADDLRQSPNTRFRGDPRVVAIITAITLLAYLPTLLGTYGISDDYFDLVLSTQDNESLPNVAIAGGRPVSGLLQELTLSLASDVASLRWLRVIGVLGVAATACVCSAILRSIGARRLVQILVGLGVAAMPSSQVIASWAVLFPVSWGAAIALAAGFSLRSLRVDTFRNRTWLLSVAAVAGVTAIGLANYQPSAMAFAPGFALALIEPSETLQRRARRAAAGLTGAAAGGVVYLVLSSALVKWRGVTADVRSSIEIPDMDKLHWFLVKVVPRSLDPLSFEPRTAVVIVVATLAVIGVASTVSGRTERLLATALVVISIFVSYLPTLMVVDRWPSARSRLAVDITVALFVGVAMHAAVLRARRYPPAETCVLIAWTAAIAGFVVFASWRVTTYYVDPQNVEFVTVSQAIRDLDLQPGATVVVVAADWRDPLARTSDLDEFGFPSMATAWGPVALIQLAVMGEGNPPLINITVVNDRSEITSPDVIVLDIKSIYAQLP